MKLPNYEDKPGPPYNHKIIGYLLSWLGSLPAFWAPYIMYPSAESEVIIDVFRYPE